MTDTTQTPPGRNQGGVPTDSRTSVPALVTYWLLGLWTLVIANVFNLVLQGVKIDGILLSLVSGLIGTQTTLLVAAVSFWVGATVGGKQSTERLAEAQKMSSAALAKIAATASPTDPAADPLAAATPAGTPEDPVSVDVVEPKP